jgi:hypothetical protein
VSNRIQVIDQSAENVINKKIIFNIRGALNFYMVCRNPPAIHMEGSTTITTALCSIEFRGNKYDGQFIYNDRKNSNDTFVLSYMIGSTKIDYIFQSITKK